jgi:nicotinate-nucleotide adenylyltransferase
METPYKLGILGGTFDPVHFGHLRMALEVGEELGLDCVCLVPAALPPHKGQRVVTPFSERLAMIRLAIKDAPLLDALDLEGRRTGPSYTVLTLKELHESHSNNLELYFIVGTDAFLDIKTWKDYRRLFDYAHFVLVERPGVSSQELEKFLELLDLGLVQTAPGQFRIKSPGNKLIRLSTTFLNISSTRVRDSIAHGRSVRFLVPDSVESYLMKRGLYELDEDA